MQQHVAEAGAPHAHPEISPPLGNPLTHHHSCPVRKVDPEVADSLGKVVAALGQPQDHVISLKPGPPEVALQPLLRLQGAKLRRLLDGSNVPFKVPRILIVRGPLGRILAPQEPDVKGPPGVRHPRGRPDATGHGAGDLSRGVLDIDAPHHRVPRVRLYKVAGDGDEGPRPRLADHLHRLVHERPPLALDHVSHPVPEHVAIHAGVGTRPRRKVGQHEVHLGVGHLEARGRAAVDKVCDAVALVFQQHPRVNGWEALVRQHHEAHAPQADPLPDRHDADVGEAQRGHFGADDGDGEVADVDGDAGALLSEDFEGVVVLVVRVRVAQPHRIRPRKPLPDVGRGLVL
mmetsp:Transcript_39961/g.100029  ORF Transcript_39961/g.100029 Transcript_39961/m.100029 type:complete len:345 (+) Transcript_39961:1368-2402(+)